MTCKDFEDSLAGALSGDAAPDEAAAHLRLCPACRSRARQILRVHETLFRTLEPFPAEFDRALNQVLRRIDQDLQSPAPPIAAAARKKIDHLSGRVRRSALLAAAVLVSILGGILWLASRPARRSLDLPLPEARDDSAAEREQLRKAEALRRAEENDLARLSEERARLERIRRAIEESARLAKERAAIDEAERAREEEARRKLDEEVSRLAALEKARAAQEPTGPEPRTPPSRTVVKVGRLEQAKGAVYVVPFPAAEKVQVQPGRDLVSGESLFTDGPGSRAVISADNSVRLELGGHSSLVWGASAAEASLARGSLSVDTTRSANESPLLLSTVHAKIEMARGRFHLHARPESTYFETRLGAAQFTNLSTRITTPIAVGQFAAAPVFPGIDPRRVDQAIRDGLEFLKKSDSPPSTVGNIANSDPLILLTFLHAGVPESDPRFQQMLRDLLRNPIDRTYTAALQAMVLEELDRVKYQARIVDCARFLVDNQCRNGEWSYGTPTTGVGGPFVDPRPDVATVAKLDASGRRVKPRVVKKVAVQKMREGPAEGDNSNSQYAALGLRACFDAGVLVPAETVQLAAKWWRDSQFADKDDRKTPYGGKGWCYHDGKGKVNGSDCCKYTYAGMTAGAAGSLVIYDFLLGRDWRSDPNVRSGLEWLTFNFSVTRNFKWGKEIPGDPEDQGAHFYYLYALERLGTFIGQEKMGKHEWYPEGAAVILERQRPDGSWMDIELQNQPVWDTCFSILFLRRATRPLVDVPSVDRTQRR
jgi:hypothetical protein